MINLSEIASLFEKLLSLSNPFAGQSFSCALIMNPYSRALRTTKNRRFILKELQNGVAGMSVLQPKNQNDYLTHFASYMPQSLEALYKLAHDLAMPSQEAETGRKRLFLLAGGDGMHREFMAAFLKANPEAMTRAIFLRLPFGTGNDSADIEGLYELWPILHGNNKLKQESAIRLKTKTGKTSYAFNIASFGLDAYVCLLTNRWKKYLPVNVFTLAADISTLVYDKLHPPALMTIELSCKENKHLFKDHFNLTVFGSSGFRSYGSKKKVLPDEENACLIRLIPSLTEKVKLKEALYLGLHTQQSEVQMLYWDEVKIDYPRKLLFQADGEVELFEAEDFPLKLSLLENILYVLKKEV